MSFSSLVKRQEVGNRQAIGRQSAESSPQSWRSCVVAPTAPMQVAWPPAGPPSPQTGPGAPFVCWLGGELRHLAPAEEADPQLFELALTGSKGTNPVAQLTMSICICAHRQLLGHLRCWVDIVVHQEAAGEFSKESARLSQL